MRRASTIGVIEGLLAGRDVLGAATLVADLRGEVEMRLIVDTDAQTLTEETSEGSREVPLYSPEAFSLLNRQWVRVGWSQRYSYGFAWFGRPIIQLPEDIVRIQEIIHRVAPDVIVETGVAHGGSLIFYAGLCKALERGRVIGVDIEIRPHNRTAIEAHPLFPFITLIEGDSAAPEVVDRVRNLIEPGERVLVLLDSNHTKAHVLAELAAYAPLVSPDSYIVAMDGIMGDLFDGPGGKPEWEWDNPSQAAIEFAAADPRFALEEPAFPFNEGQIDERVTYWPSAYLRRLPGV
jgi:cephalosporin hydroxylase